MLGLWAFTNLEMAYAQLRVDERARAYVYASGANVAMTVAFTVLLVVFADQGARGLLLGNFGASAVVVLGLWWVLRRRVLAARAESPTCARCCASGCRRCPADASVYALQVADRFYLFRVFSHAAAGRYAIAIKLATVVFVAVRGFQYAWPPLAYSIESDEEAARLYSLVTTYYALATGVVVCAVALLGRWMVRLLAAHAVLRRIPRAAVAGARLGAVRPVSRVRRDLRPRTRHLAQLSRRARRPRRQRRPALVLVPRSGAGLGIAGAGIALCGAYVAMLLVMYPLTRSLFRVGFEWLRLVELVAILAGVAVSGRAAAADARPRRPRGCASRGSRWCRRRCC